VYQYDDWYTRWAATFGTPNGTPGVVTRLWYTGGGHWAAPNGTTWEVTGLPAISDLAAHHSTRNVGQCPT